MSDAPVNMQDDLLDNLLSDFLDESDQLLTQLNDNLLQLDEWVQSLEEGQDPRCDADLLNEMFRAAHSIKGLSAMLGLDDINTLTHKIENVFDAARSNQLDVNADVVDLVFMGLDRLTAQVERLKAPDAEPVNCESVLTGIRDLLKSAGAEREKTSQADAEQTLAGCMAEAGVDNQSAPVDPLQDVQDEDDISETYLSIFIDEAEMSLDQLSGSLMALEDCDDDSVAKLRNLLGTVHKIKGSAASIGLNRAAKLSHLMEDTLETYVQQNRAPSPDTIDQLLACIGALQQYVTDLRSGSAKSEHFGQLARNLLHESPAPAAAANLPVATLNLRDRLENLITEVRDRLKPEDPKTVGSTAGMSPCTVQRMQTGANVKLDSLRTLATYLDDHTSPVVCHVPSDNPSNATAAEQHDPSIDRQPATPTADAPAETTAGSLQHDTTYVGQVYLEPNLPLAGLKAHLIHEKLIHLGELIDCEPPSEQLDELDDLDCFRFRLMSDQSQETIEQQINLGGVQSISIQVQKSEADAPLGVQPAAGPTSNEATDTRTSPTATSDPSSAASAPDTVERSVSNTTTSATATGSESAQASQSNTSPQPPAKAAKARNTDTAHRPAETVRVDIERLDQLMDLAGQLVINKAQFGQIGDRFRSVLNCKQSVQALDRISIELNKMESSDFRFDEGHHNEELQLLKGQIRRVQTYLEPLHHEVQTLSQAREYVHDLTEAIHQLGRVSDGIQQGVMDTRMVPVGPLFARFKRVVRDITRANGKQVRLDIRGEKTELDKRMIDELGDPLVHMVRNSADHGIELPADREAAGKPAQGTVTLDACHRGNSILIRVSDDGKGLDTDRILSKCIQKGILNATEAEKLTPHQIHQLIWEPGLSTADKVTDVSGRGMGMDIVKSKIDELNGTVEIESAPGEGTSITIKLPLTLAILPSLMVDIGGDVFAMPMEAVIEIVSVQQDQLSSVHGQQTALVRGRVVSVVELTDAMSFHGTFRPAADGEDKVLVILGEPGREIGLLVDRVVGEEDVVIKSIADNYKNIQGIAGASILGDGRVSLILDIAALIDTVSASQATVN